MKRHHELRPNGALVDVVAVRSWLADMDSRAPKRVNVERLSKADAEIVAFEATERGSRAAA